MAGKVVLITGASSGIGEATARRLQRAGLTVYAAARRVERMEALRAQGVYVLGMDVTNDASMVSGVAEVIAEQGRIDVLINNAGYGSYGALEDVPLAEARCQFEVNVFGLARLTQLVLPHMRRQAAGRIVNVSSIGGRIWEPMGSWYHATKFAVEGLSDSLRMEVKDFGIDVVVIEPGLIRSEWSDIAAQNLLKTSGSTAYGALARQSAGMLSQSYTRSSDPDVIAQTIERAVLARRPRTRYAAGALAGASLFMRRLLPDRAFDRLMELMARLNQPRTA